MLGVHISIDSSPSRTLRDDIATRRTDFFGICTQYPLSDTLSASESICILVLCLFSDLSAISRLTLFLFFTGSLLLITNHHLIASSCHSPSPFRAHQICASSMNHCNLPQSRRHRSTLSPSDLHAAMTQALGYYLHVPQLGEDFRERLY
jgi:hypothetical protein